MHGRQAKVGFALPSHNPCMMDDPTITHCMPGRFLHGTPALLNTTFLSKGKEMAACTERKQSGWREREKQEEVQKGDVRMHGRMHGSKAGVGGWKR